MFGEDHRLNAETEASILQISSENERKPIDKEKL